MIMKLTHISGSNIPVLEVDPYATLATIVIIITPATNSKHQEIAVI